MHGYALQICKYVWAGEALNSTGIALPLNSPSPSHLTISSRQQERLMEEIYITRSDSTDLGEDQKAINYKSFHGLGIVERSELRPEFEIND
jgi:hypothetical protein